MAKAGLVGAGIARSLAAAILFHSSLAQASAQPSDRVALEWEAPPVCPSSEAVVAEVDRLLGDKGARPPKPLRVRVVVTQDGPSSFQARLEAPGSDGAHTRELRGSSCSSLANAAALIVALMIDPSAAMAAPPPPEPPAAPPPPSPEPPAAPPEPSAAPPEPPAAPPEPEHSEAPAAPTPPVPSLPPPAAPAPPLPTPPPVSPVLVPRATAAPSRFPPLSFRIGVLVGGDVGTLPGPSLDLGAMFAAQVDWMRIELGAFVLLDREVTLPEQPSAGGRVQLFAGKLGACPMFVIGAFEAAPCLGFELGRLHASGFGVSSPSEASVLWAAFNGGGLFAWVPASRIALTLRAGAAIPLTLPRFVLENLGPVDRPGPIDGRASLGAEVRF